MTNKEQTISNLKKLKSFHNGSYGADIDRAIKSLEQEPCEDAISREVARRIIDSGRTRDQMLEMVESAVAVDSSTDCISREAAIEIIESWLFCDDYNEAERNIMGAMQSVLYDLPSVKPKFIDEEIQTMQDLEQAEIQKAYEIGKAE